MYIILNCQTSSEKHDTALEDTQIKFLSMDEDRLKKRAERFGMNTDTVVNRPSKEQMIELYER